MASPRRGISLIELLMIVAIISILAATMIIVFDPHLRIVDTQDAARRHRARTVENAALDYQREKRMYAAEGIPDGEDAAKQICRLGRFDADCLNIDVLVPDHVSCIPYDEAQQESSDILSGYAIYKNAGVVAVKSLYVDQDRSEGGGCDFPLRVANLYWPIEDGPGSVVIDDSSSDGNNGNLIDGNTANADGNTPPQWSTDVPPALAGRSTYSLQFDGTDDYVQSWVEIPEYDTFTVSLWIKDIKTDTGHTPVFLSLNQHAFQLIETSGNDTLRYYNSGDGAWYDAPNAVAENTWTHVAVTMDDSELILYVDGTAVGIFSANFNLPNVFMRIGTYSSVHTLTPGFLWEGYIDDVRVYNAALSEQQVQSISVGL